MGGMVAAAAVVAAAVWLFEVAILPRAADTQHCLQCHVMHSSVHLLILVSSSTCSKTLQVHCRVIDLSLVDQGKGSEGSTVTSQTPS